MAVQLTANNGTGSSTDNTMRIDDLEINAVGIFVAYSQGLGTFDNGPEDLFMITLFGGTPIRISAAPGPGGQCIARGSVRFTPASDGLVWVQGTGFRHQPMSDTVAFWNALAGGTTPLRLTSAPVATHKWIEILNTSPLNP